MGADIDARKASKHRPAEDGPHIIRVAPAGSGGPGALDAAWRQELEEGRFADTTFRVEGVDFYYSRMPFAVASPVFGAMLFPNNSYQGESSAKRSRVEWKEHKAGAVVELEGITAEVFSQMARYVYRGELRLTAWNVVQLRKAADMYQMDKLAECVEGVISELLANRDPCSALGLINAEVETHGEVEEYGLHALELGGDCLQSPSFSSLDERAVEWVLSSQIEADEDDVWTAVRSWATGFCRKSGTTWQDVLRPLARFIRFQHLSEKLFDTEVCRTGLLSDEQEVAILLHARGSVTISSLPGPRIIPFKFDVETAAPGTTMGSSDTYVEFSSDPTHRCVFATPAVESGVHSWTISWTKIGCCGVAGIASAAQFARGSNDKGLHLAHRNVVHFGSGGKKGATSVPRREGASVAMTVNMNTKNINFRMDDGTHWTGKFTCEGPIHPMIDSDENNGFSIRGGIHLPHAWFPSVAS